MKIAVIIYIDGFDKLYTDDGENKKFWDTHGAAQAIDDDLHAFPISKFSFPSVRPLNGYILKGIISDKYKFLVVVSTFEQREKLKLKLHPTIIFWDTVSKVEKGRIEGSPFSTGVVKQALTKIFAENENKAGLSLFSLTKTQKRSFSFAALLLLLFKLKNGKNGM